MPDSKVEVKACPWCQQQPIKRTDSYIPDAVACPNGHTSPMRLSEWNNRPIANNGVSEEIDLLIKEMKEYCAGPCGQDYVTLARRATTRQWRNKLVRIMNAKLQPTAPRGGM